MRKKLVLFAVMWFGFAFVAFYETGLLGAFAVGTGASDQELRELLETYSVPLGWINSSLVVRPDTPIATAFGIILLNAFFWTVPVFAAWRIVRYFLTQSKTTQLGLGASESNPTDEDDL